MRSTFRPSPSLTWKPSAAVTWKPSAAAELELHRPLDRCPCRHSRTHEGPQRSPPHRARRALRVTSSVRASPRWHLPLLHQLTTSSLPALLLRLPCPLSATVKSRSSVKATNLSIPVTVTTNESRASLDQAPEAARNSLHLSFCSVADQRPPMSSGKDDSSEFDAELHRSSEQARRVSSRMRAEDLENPVQLRTATPSPLCSSREAQCAKAFVKKTR